MSADSGTTTPASKKLISYTTDIVRPGLSKQQQLSSMQIDQDGQLLHNVGAQGISYFTPEQNPPAGTAIKGPDGSIPKLFTPLKIRGVELPNRIWVSPMCQYSSHGGFTTPWHEAHYGGMVLRGPGFMMLEATAVQARGRISPEDLGIWLDAHVEGLHKLVEFAHSQNALIGIQIGHAGRKATTLAPWLARTGVASEEANGWPNDIFGPTDQSHNPQTYATPRAMTLADIEQVKKDFQAGVARAVRAGFDIIEFHFAHGFLVSSFMSALANTRTDQYGGSFQNRTRLALEIVENARAIVPEGMPLFVRISATDYLDNHPDFAGRNWTVDDSIRLAHLLAEAGIDVLDISSGGMHAAQEVPMNAPPGYQARIAKKIKKALGNKLLVSGVGSIKTGTLAEQIISGGSDEDDTPLDLVAAGRLFQKNPGLVWAWAEELDTSVQVAHQIGWSFGM